MTFSPRAFLVFAAFLGALSLGMYAGNGRSVNLTLAIPAGLAVVAIEVLVWFGPFTFQRKG